MSDTPKFTDSARRLLHLAMTEAQRFGSPSVRPVHLLLASISLVDFVPAQILKHLGVEYDSVVDVLKTRLGAEEVPESERQPLSQIDTTSICQRVSIVASAGYRMFVAPSTLLMSLCLKDADNAELTEVFAGLGIDWHNFREESVQLNGITKEDAWARALFWSTSESTDSEANEAK